MSPAHSMDLASRVGGLAGTRVLVVGDIMLDRYVSGSVKRISPEAPVPVLKAEHTYSMLGGAGNVVRNLAALGAIPSFVGVAAEDAEGGEIRALLAESGGDFRLLVESSRPTTQKIRYLAGAHQLLRVDRERSGPLSEETSAALLAAAEEAMQGVGVVVLSDYAKGVLSPTTVGSLLEAARRAGCRVIVDPKALDFSVYRGADLITPNRDELAAASGMAASGDAEIGRVCRELSSACDIGAVLVTRGEEGMSLVTREGQTRHFPARAREVFDVSGAGDTVVAVLSAVLAAGGDLPGAAELANLAAGVVVGKIGTAVVRPDELLHALHQEDWMEVGRKIVSLESVLEQARVWRHAGLRVGFTNGCFDLIHPGHVSLLRQARGACDRLIVGLNSDASVRRLKGEGRPVQPESARAAVLASLTDVDRVVTFGADTPLELIEAIRPDVLVKGADYSRGAVVGGDLVERYGGRVLLAELMPGHSTSATIRRVGAAL